MQVNFICLQVAKYTFNIVKKKCVVLSNRFTNFVGA